MLLYHKYYFTTIFHKKIEIVFILFLSKYYLHFSSIKSAIEKVEKEFSGNGRVLIRPSGTEPLVRVMIEGKDIKVIEQRAKEIADLIEEKCK